MSATSADLATYVGLPSANALVDRCLAEAAALVDGFLTGETIRFEGQTVGVPWRLVDRAKLEVGAELYHRKNTKNAVAQFATPDGQPIRIARDPMVAAYPLLKPFMRGGFA